MFVAERQRLPLLGWIVVLCLGCGARSIPHSEATIRSRAPARVEPSAVGTRIAMGAEFRISIFDLEPDVAALAAERALARIAELEDVISSWDSKSEIRRACEVAGNAPVELSALGARAVATAQKLYQETAGAYDPTVGAWLRLHGFKGKLLRQPTPQEFELARASVGGESISLVGRVLRLARPGTEIDLDGIAKGLATDVAMDELRRAGTADAIVWSGGSTIGVHGPPSEYEPREVQLESENEPESGSEIVYLRNATLSTSGALGTVQRLENGETVSHLWNARMQCWSNSPWRSVTVIAERGDLSDGVATALAIEGPNPDWLTPEAARRLGILEICAIAGRGASPDGQRPASYRRRFD